MEKKFHRKDSVHKYCIKIHFCGGGHLPVTGVYPLSLQPIDTGGARAEAVWEAKIKSKAKIANTLTVARIIAFVQTYAISVLKRDQRKKEEKKKRNDDIDILFYLLQKLIKYG